MSIIKHISKLVLCENQSEAKALARSSKFTFTMDDLTKLKEQIPVEQFKYLGWIAHRWDEAKDIENIADVINQYHAIASKGIMPADINSYKSVAEFIADVDASKNKQSKTGMSKSVKSSGINALTEGEDYLNFPISGSYTGYMPLTYDASRMIASDAIGDCVGKWCTAYQKTDKHFNDYVYTNGVSLIYFIGNNEKIAVAVYPDGMNWEMYDEFDGLINTSQGNGPEVVNLLPDVKLSEKYADHTELDLDIDEILSKRELLNTYRRVSKEVKPPESGVLGAAIKSGDISTIEDALSRGAKPDDVSIEQAMITRNVDIVKMIVDAGATPDIRTLYTAIAIGEVDIVEYIIDSGVAPNTKALDASLNNPKTEIIQLLIDRGAIPDQDIISKAQELGDEFSSIVSG